jgi:hypothetical protein
MKGRPPLAPDIENRASVLTSCRPATAGQDRVAKGATETAQGQAPLDSDPAGFHRRPLLSRRVVVTTRFRARWPRRRRSREPPRPRTAVRQLARLGCTPGPPSVQNPAHVARSRTRAGLLTNIVSVSNPARVAARRTRAGLCTPPAGARRRSPTSRRGGTAELRLPASRLRPRSGRTRVARATEAPPPDSPGPGE